MELSMWVLADWLEGYCPQTSILDGSPTLRNARLFTSKEEMQEPNVYIGQAHDILGDDAEGVVCINGSDTILLKTKNTDHILNEVLGLFDYYSTWFAEMEKQITRGCSMQYLISCSVIHFDGMISTCNPAFTNTTFSIPENNKLSGAFFDDMVERRIMSLDIALELNHDSRIREPDLRDAYVIENDLLPCRLLCVNLVVNNTHYGWVALLESNYSITQGRIHACMHACIYYLCPYA